MLASPGGTVGAGPPTVESLLGVFDAPLNKLKRFDACICGLVCFVCPFWVVVTKLLFTANVPGFESAGGARPLPEVDAYPK